MKKISVGYGLFFWCFCSVFISSSNAFESGSSGIDGNFDPPSDYSLFMPSNTFLRYNNFRIREGVTVTIKKFSAKTPAVILVKGDAEILGNLVISGEDGRDAARFASQASAPPGGFVGGVGNRIGVLGGKGGGPSGGLGGLPSPTSSDFPCGGLGGGHGALAMELAFCQQNVLSPSDVIEADGALGNSGVSYGNALIQPLIGGSGGGGGIQLIGPGSHRSAAGGGSGGGALLLAASGTILLQGSIDASGGDGGRAYSQGSLIISGFNREGAGGGGGAGGAVRLVSSKIFGSGVIDVTGGVSSNSSISSSSQFVHVNRSSFGGHGAAGRVRVESDDDQFIGEVLTVQGIQSENQESSVVRSEPLPLFIPSSPTVRISDLRATLSLGGLSNDFKTRVSKIILRGTQRGPIEPSFFSSATSGVIDVVENSPIEIDLEARGVSPGSSVTMIFQETRGMRRSVRFLSPPLQGTLALSTATMEIPEFEEFDLEAGSTYAISGYIVQ